ncbi:site-determining protein [Clostridia bacterium]|nr:site-determining protein [Clostridia bacterium]
MSFIIALLSGDGGVGKTTLVAALGARLAAAGRKALVIDCCAGFRRLDMMLGMESRVMYDAGDAASGYCQPERAVLRDSARKLPDLLAAPYDADTPPDEDLWARMLDSYRKQYDWIALDTPTGTGPWAMMAARLADRAYVVLSPDDGSMRSAERVLERLRLEGHERSQSAMLIINKLRLSYIDQGIQYAPDVVIQTLDAQVVGVIPEDENLRMAAALARLDELDAKAPVVLELDALARRTMGAPLPKGWMVAKSSRFLQNIGVKSGTKATLKEVWV